MGGILHCRPSTFCGFSFIIAVLHPSAAHSSVEACCLLMNVNTQASCAQLCSLLVSFGDSCQTLDGKRGHAGIAILQ